MNTSGGEPSQTSELVNFLLIYSYAEQRLVTLRQIADTTEALAAYRAAEHDFNARRYEVVLLGGDSVEGIMQNHGHYFREATSDAPFLDLLD